jgi:hypothetical protein
MKKIVLLICLLSFQIQAATFTVVNSNDSGAGSLRQAILDANSSAGRDLINFNIPGVGPHVIQPLTNLPVISEQLTMDGYSQPGSSANTLMTSSNASIQIVLDGNQISPQAIGLQVNASTTIISGLSIVNFTTAGVLLSSETATATESITITGNFIGLMSDGISQAPNGTGIVVSRLSRNNQIGGSDAAEKNVISANLVDGILIESDFNSVLGNLIGTDAGGEIARGNGNGVRVLPPLPTSNAEFNLIGSNLTQEANIISGNLDNGIVIDGVFSASGVPMSQVIGNFIGLSSSGKNTLGNTNSGIFIRDGVNTEIRDNVIGGNFDGIQLTGLTRGSNIENNIIGGNPTTGNTNDGININSGAGPNNIGNPLRTVGNVISFNGRNGISVDRTDTQENRIMFNTISNNGLLGIDLIELGALGVSENDAGDSDFGPNDLLNFPILTSAVLNNGALEITGNYDGLSNHNFIFEVFASSLCDSSGNGEGELILGHIVASSDNNGHVFLSQSFSSPASGFDFITALATDEDGNTSEFSPCMAVSGIINSYSVAVNVSGLVSGNTLELQNNLSDNLIVTSNGISTFSTSLTDGLQYSVTVVNQPTTPAQNCSVMGASGTINGTDIIVDVTCETTAVLGEPVAVTTLSLKALILLISLILVIYKYTKRVKL